MNYPLPESNLICHLLGHRYGRMYFVEPYVRRTCWLDGHTIPPLPTVPQSREDYDDWCSRGMPKDDKGNWIPGPREGETVREFRERGGTWRG